MASLLQNTEHQIRRRLSEPGSSATLSGCAGSFAAMLLARLATGRLPGGGPLLVLTPDEERAAEVLRELTFFHGAGSESRPFDAGPVMHLPAVESSPYTDSAGHRGAAMQRLATLFRLSQGYGGEVLVASAQALRQLVIPPPAFAALCQQIVAEQELDRDELVGRLQACGFARTPVVEDPGTYSVRGFIVDLFPPLFRLPVRLEFYGDWVESIRLFDPSSQRTLRDVREVMLHPVRETIPTEGAALRPALLAAADAVNHPSTKTRAILEELESGRHFFGAEALMPAFHRRLVPLWRYLPDDAPVALLDPEAVRVVLEEADARSEEAYQARLEQGRISFAPGRFFVPAEELSAELARRRRLLLPPALAGDEPELVECFARDNGDIAAELALARKQRGEAIVSALGERLQRWQEEGRPVVLAAGSRGQVERLDALLRGHDFDTEVDETPGAARLLLGALDPERVLVQAGDLGRGFRLPGGLVVLTHGEIFGPKARRSPPRKGFGPGLGDLRDLQEDDLVVHAEHGVGRYQGLVKLEFQGAPADFMQLEFCGGDKLYLPVYRMNQVQKYLGTQGAEPKLDRLGGVTWAKKKGRVRQAVRKLAEDLLQLYAQRAALSGHAYPPGEEDYAEFEATFPFTETEDQAKAIDDVYGDLTAERPMDRLVCGDVGFGKTEVAIRAAFLAAMSGRQVAVLAPTTVLVEQHLRSFADRIGPFPLRVESVSRFRKPKELRAVLGDLAEGKVDIVVGTHRLLSSDVRFKDLGLLIIDEEQRFGVAHKEKLKRLRTQLDVLTLTATPIPRTLQMSMIGLREISLITTPPVDRLAIRTLVQRFDEVQVAEAIRRELDRGGQVFFVHNRVQSIAQWAERVADLAPEASVGVAHGQMDPRALEKVMLRFVSGEHDILVCTAIIESGLDIPRANTMFINRADRFGLGQLYQLRGRIGRSRQRAYCYLLVPGIEAMSGEARQRLATLQRFTELGSGFSVASHDLEIRGAGELLGGRQSGQIAAVGFETYARILAEAVAELQGEPITRETDPELNTGISAFIPEEYVEDTGQRLDLYRRLSAGAADEDELQSIAEEMQDRYGPAPEEVEALVELMAVKGLAAALDARVVDIGEARVALTLGENTPLSAPSLVTLVSDRSAGYRLTPQMRLLRSLGPAEQLQPLAAAKKILHDLVVYAKRTQKNIQ